MSRIWSGILSSQTFGEIAYYAFSGYHDGSGSGTGTVSPVAVSGWRNGFTFLYADPAIIASMGDFYDAFLSFSPSLSKMGIGTNQSPYIHVYNWVPGWGTKYANPSTLPQYLSRGISFSKQEDSIALTVDGPPGIIVYRWSSATGFGTKYTDPTPAQSTSSNNIDFSPSGNVILIADIISPYIHAYVWSSTTGFGTKYANPANLPPTSTNTVYFSPSGNNIICHTGDTSCCITAYAWSNGFGAKYANPATPPTGGGQTVGSSRFSPSESDIAVTNAAGIINAYAWSSGFGTKYANPTSIPANFIGSDIEFYSRPGGTVNAIGVINTNSAIRIDGCLAWSWSVSGFGTKFANIAPFQNTSTPYPNYLSFKGK